MFLLLPFQLLTVIVLILLDPSYVTAYISVNYEIVLIYIISALTLLYCIVSVGSPIIHQNVTVSPICPSFPSPQIIMYAVMQRSVGEGEELHLTNCALSVRLKTFIALFIGIFF